MNRNHKNHSPTHQHQQLFHKNNKLYQQLLQGDYLGNIVSQNTKKQPSNIAPIKFNISYPNSMNNVNYMQNYQINNQIDSNTAKHNNLFKNFQSSNTKINYSYVNKSFPDTFSIIQHENQENSTINIYSLSKNQIQHDLSISSNNVTVKAILEEQFQSSQPFQSAAQSKQSNFILNSSILHQQQQKNQKMSIISQSQKFKKYKSQEFSYNIGSKNYDNTIQEQLGKVPKIIAEKNIKNEINRKFSGSSNHQNDQNNFKAVINEIHIVPYMINNQVKPYAFTVPTESDKKPKSNKEQSNKSISLPYQQLKKSSLKSNDQNLHKSNYHSQQNAQDNMVLTNRKQYCSTHPHIQHQKNNLNNSNRTINSLESSKINRTAPKSQPKYHIVTQKTIRSNSIQNKSKPTIGIKVTSQTRQHKEKRVNIQNNKLGRSLKNEQKYNPEQKQRQDQSPCVQFQQQSIIYQSNTFDICCSFPKNQVPINKMIDQPNKINYLPTNIKNIQNLKYNSQSSSHQYLQITSKIQNQSKDSYKINSIQSIKGKYQSIEDTTRVKKGLRLVGYVSKKVQQ